MARKNRDLERLDREEAVRKIYIRAAAAAAGILLLLLAVFFVKGRLRAAEAKKQAEAEAAREAARLEEEAAAKAGEEVNDFEEIVFPSDEAYTSQVTILGTGDNLIHEALYEDARTEDGGYDFTPFYELVKEDISAADLATVNQETPLATAIAPASGYPKFNTPTEAGDALIDAGFDVINEANNHVMDQGTEGVYATLDYWDMREIPYVGAYRDTADLLTPRILEVNGIKVAFLGFAEDLNVELPSDTEIQVVSFFDEEMIEDLIREAKSEADIVVVHAHWGVEEVDELTRTMTSFSQKMVDWGADIIFGNHTHILQELRILTRESDGELCPVIFSMGNFVSGQQLREELLSGLLTIRCGKNPETGDARVEGVSFRPVVTHYEGDRHNVKIYPVDQYNDELCWDNGVKTDDYPLTMDYLWELVSAHISPQFMDARTRASYETYLKEKELKAAQEAQEAADAEGAPVSLLLDEAESGQ